MQLLRALKKKGRSAVMEDRPREEKRYYFYRDQLIALGIGFAITSLIIFILGILAGKRMEQGATAERAASAVKIPVSPAQPEPVTPAGPQTVPGDQTPPPKVAKNADAKAAKEPKAREKAADTEIKKTPPVKNAAPTEAQPPAVKSAGEKPQTVARQEQRQTTETAKKSSAERVWTVQIKSSPDKKFADTWVNRLQSKGYDAFVVEGDVKGQIWYRVRVGHFTAKQEAEELRMKLETQEALSGGFLTMTDGGKPELGGQKSENKGQ